MTQHMLLLGGNGLLGRHVRRSAGSRGWDVTPVALHADSGVRACTSEAALASIVGKRRWRAVLDLRAYDDRSARVVTRSLSSSATYILVSSIYAYCHPRTHPERDLGGLVETDVLSPTGPYGQGKVSAEQVALSSNLEAVHVVRLPFVFGVGDRSGRTEQIRKIVTSGTVETSDIDFEVGLVSAPVVAERLVRIAEGNPQARGVLNVDGGCNWTLLDHLKAAAVAFRRHRQDQERRDPELPFHLGRDYSLNSTALHRLLELDPNVDLERQWRDVADAW